MNFIIRNIYKYNDGIDKYCIYLGDSDNSNQIIVAEVGVIDNARQYKIISCLTNMVMFIDKILYIHPNTVISPLFIKKFLKVFKGGGAGAGGFFKKHLSPHKNHSPINTHLSTKLYFNS